MARHTLEAVTGPETLNEIQQTLDAAFGNDEISDYTKMCIELAVSEIGTNIIEYSGDGEPVRLTMEVDVAQDTVTVKFTDDGHPAPIDLTQVSMPDEAAEGGRGLAIAFRVLDELSYTRDKDGNHWTLIRRQSE
jgi:serine/threonine-protein kinase RsbW